MGPSPSHTATGVHVKTSPPTSALSSIQDFFERGKAFASALLTINADSQWRCSGPSRRYFITTSAFTRILYHPHLYPGETHIQVGLRRPELPQRPAPRCNSDN